MVFFQLMLLEFGYCIFSIPKRYRRMWFLQQGLGLMSLFVGDLFHITFKHLSGMISPRVGWCSIGTFTNPCTNGGVKFLKIMQQFLRVAHRQIPIFLPCQLHTATSLTFFFGAIPVTRFIVSSKSAVIVWSTIVVITEHQNLFRCHLEELQNLV